MSFEELCYEYLMQFGENPPILTTLSVDDKEYLELLKEAINSNRKLTQDDLAEIFMRNEKVVY